jgi:hypothetical protein
LTICLFAVHVVASGLPKKCTGSATAIWVSCAIVALIVTTLIEKGRRTMIAIKHRYTNTTLCEFDVSNIRFAVESAVANDAYLSGAYLSGAYLSGADLRSAYLSGADLSGADLSDADLRGADLSGADLRSADLRSAYLSGADLSGADLSDADLSGADLSGADLRSAYLSGADLRSAYLSGADLSGADLSDADLSGADLSGEILTKTPIYISNLLWPVTITTQFLTIGCQRHKIDKWNAFDDEGIASMHPKALDFWSVWKSPLLAMCEAHRAA